MHVQHECQWKKLFSACWFYRKLSHLIWASALEVWKWTVLSSGVLTLPEMEAPHLGVSSKGMEVDGGFAKVARSSRGSQKMSATMNSMEKKHQRHHQQHDIHAYVRTEKRQ